MPDREKPSLHCRRMTEADRAGVMRLQKATLAVRFTQDWYDELLYDHVPSRYTTVTVPAAAVTTVLDSQSSPRGALLG